MVLTRRRKDLSDELNELSTRVKGLESGRKSKDDNILMNFIKSVLSSAGGPTKETIAFTETITGNPNKGVPATETIALTDTFDVKRECTTFILGGTPSGTICQVIIGRQWQF